MLAYLPLPFPDIYDDHVDVSNRLKRWRRDWIADFRLLYSCGTLPLEPLLMPVQDPRPCGNDRCMLVYLARK